MLLNECDKKWQHVIKMRIYEHKIPVYVRTLSMSIADFMTAHLL